MKTVLRFVLIALVLTCMSLVSGRASAYPWMIRHEYPGCASCHADPSGGGLLNYFGRSQGEVLMRTPFGREKDDDAGKAADFLFGIVKVPDKLLLGGDVRGLFLRRMPSGSKAINDIFLMQADLQAQLSIGRFRTNASVGFSQRGAEAARITRSDENNLVSRVHWLGFDVGEEKDFLVRIGRMNLPFGLRSIEHTMWTRTETRTDINGGQQYGAALAWNKDKIRAEVMAILGNFAVSPDDFRSRGYAGYFEYAATPKLALGASSMVTRAETDTALLSPAWRHAHGAFARYSPKKFLVLSSEFDFLHTSQRAPGSTYFGAASQVTADFEITQGLHLASTVELATRSFTKSNLAVSTWATAWWFFAPHADLRVDAIFQNGRPSFLDPAPTPSRTLLVQAHFYL